MTFIIGVWPFQGMDVERHFHLLCVFIVTKRQIETICTNGLDINKTTKMFDKLAFFLLCCLCTIVKSEGDCRRRGVHAIVEAFYSMDDHPIIAGYDDVEPWQYGVINATWANNGILDNNRFSTNTSGPVYILDSHVYPIQECNVLQLTLVAQFAITNVTLTLPNGTVTVIPFDPSQPNYGSGIFQAYDSTTGLVYGFVLTNALIYGLYGRLPQPGSEYTAFTYLVPIFQRVNVEQFHILQLAFSKRTNSIIFRVDGDDKMIIENSGRRLDSKFILVDYMNPPGSGMTSLVYPNQVQMSLGILTLNSLYNSTSPCIGLYDYCDCRQSLVDAKNTICYYAPFTGRYNTTMEMMVSSLGVSRMVNIDPVCRCDCSSSSSECRQRTFCRPASPSSSSSCSAHDSSNLSFW